MSVSLKVCHIMEIKLHKSILIELYLLVFNWGLNFQRASYSVGGFAENQYGKVVKLAHSNTDNWQKTRLVNTDQKPDQNCCVTPRVVFTNMHEVRPR